MPKVTCPEDCFLPALDREVKKGETVDVSTDLAESLLANPDRGWKAAKITKTEK